MSKINRAVIVLIGSNLIGNVYASDQFRPSWDDVSVDVGVGMLSTTTKERLYDPTNGHKDSQLNWRVRNSAVLNAEVEWRVLPKLSFGLSGWTTFSKRGGMMNDYDWEDEDQKSWTSKSHHPRSYLNRSNQFDLNMKYWLLSNDAARIGVVSGYQQTRYRFSAYGGSYNYNNGGQIGQAPDDLLGISYRQTYKTPYIGLLASYRYQQWEVGGGFKYSAWGRASDVDDHHAADTTFTSLVTKQKSTSLSLNGGYYLTDNAKVYLEGTWGRTFNRKGTGRYHDREEGTSGSSKNSAGIENTSLMASIGMRYTF
ncbi:omptin family outer membrane protease [Rosenbergiella epipactidis]|uniref:omptin family outer membrane protease n=1 Tax=Rosenbergiella epipactidis TaxID=1544694 RepID=UPI002026D1B2|nr:omptin family outer membrane protease [Rosenbergiella epipactidis]MCL9669076.1 omptin family outer membrane protease [Rosenbergiella epipactidis]